MRRFISFFTLLLVLASTLHAQAKQAALYAAMAPAEQYLIANPENEIALARSAAPTAISADADVLVLGQGEERVCMFRRAFLDREFR